MKKQARLLLSNISLTTITVLLLLMAFSHTANAVVRITVASPKAIQLNSGKPIRVNLKGSDLNKVRGARLFKDPNGRIPVRGLTGRYRGNARSGKLTLKLNGRVPAGKYYVRLTDGRKVIAPLPISIHINSNAPTRTPQRNVTPSRRIVPATTTAQRAVTSTPRTVLNKPLNPALNRLPRITRITGLPRSPLKAGNKLNLTLIGNNLNNLSRAQLLIRNRPAGKAILGNTNNRTNQQRPLTLQLGQKINPGNLQLKLFANSKPVSLPGNIKLSIAAPVKINQPAVVVKANIPSSLQPGRSFPVTILAKDDQAVTGLEIKYQGKTKTIKTQRKKQTTTTISLIAPKTGKQKITITALDGSQNKGKPYTLTARVSTSIARQKTLSTLAVKQPKQTGSTQVISGGKTVSPLAQRSVKLNSSAKKNTRNQKTAKTNGTSAQLSAPRFGRAELNRTNSGGSYLTLFNFSNFSFFQAANQSYYLQPNYFVRMNGVKGENCMRNSNYGILKIGCAFPSIKVTNGQKYTIEVGKDKVTSNHKSFTGYWCKKPYINHIKKLDTPASFRLLGQNFLPGHPEAKLKVQVQEVVGQTAVNTITNTVINTSNTSIDLRLQQDALSGKQLKFFVSVEGCTGYREQSVGFTLTQPQLKTAAAGVNAQKVFTVPGGINSNATLAIRFNSIEMVDDVYNTFPAGKTGLVGKLYRLRYWLMNLSNQTVNNVKSSFQIESNNFAMQSASFRIIGNPNSNIGECSMSKARATCRVSSMQPGETRQGYFNFIAQSDSNAVRFVLNASGDNTNQLQHTEIRSFALNKKMTADIKPVAPALSQPFPQQTEFTKNTFEQVNLVLNFGIRNNGPAEVPAGTRVLLNMGSTANYAYRYFLNPVNNCAWNLPPNGQLPYKNFSLMCTVPRPITAGQQYIFSQPLRLSWPWSGINWTPLDKLEKNLKPIIQVFQPMQTTSQGNFIHSFIDLTPENDITRKPVTLCPGVWQHSENNNTRVVCQ